jgi:membrane-associated PAP2 superfamily phosphatase
MKRGQASGFAEPMGITLALLLVALAWDASGLDVPFAHLAGSVAGFPWRDHWLLTRVLHEGGRDLAWLAALALCLGVWWPMGPLARIGPSERLQLAVSTLLAALAVSLLKSGSQTSCPWDLADFGGLAHYASHWTLRPDGGAGRCFPAGHAASGFSFVTGYFAFRGHDAKTARGCLVGALLAGLVLGLGQQWRGAHFMSHTLWSAVACWGTASILAAAWPRAFSAQGT